MVDAALRYQDSAGRVERMTRASGNVSLISCQNAAPGKSTWAT
jgi:hypothetical protein